MKSTWSKEILFSLFVLTLPLAAQGGLQDLVRPNLDLLREKAEKEREAELEKERKLAEEEKARQLEEERKRKELEAIKSDPMVDISDIELAGDSTGKDSYTIESGGTLGAIARDRYGSGQYYPIVEHWNDVTATKIYVGQVIKTPSMATIMKVKGEKVLSRYPEEVAAMLQLREDYLALQDELIASGGSPDEELRAKLAEMHKTAKKIHAGFLVKRPGVANYATGLLSQCKNVADQFAAMKEGDLGRRNSRIARVHTSLAYAMRNAMIWGQEDFK